MAAPNFCFVFVDLTTSATPDPMRPASSFETIIEAALEAANGPWADAYGKLLLGMRVGSGPTDRGTNEIAVNFRDTIPEAPGALAYHEIVNGIPDIELGVDLFLALLAGEESLCSGFTHEFFETLLDPGCNLWADLGNGTMRAKEACDTVQNVSYAASNGASVSDFLLPSAWVPGASGPWDYKGAMTSQDDYSGGYEIQATTPASEQQVGGMKKAVHFLPPVGRAGFGNLSELARKRKSHPFSRTARRLALRAG